MCIRDSGSGHLKKRLFNELHWEKKCYNIHCNSRENCINLEGIIVNTPLQLDHINGDHQDNRLENLRLLCPNCHALTNTYCGKNIKCGRVVQKKCKDCNIDIQQKSTRCIPCASKNIFLANKNGRPSYEQLQQDLKEMPYVKVGKKYNVSDNAVRKWLKRYEKYDSL